MRVALYTRVSTEDQAREGFSLEVQKNYLLQYAKNFQWMPVCTISGKDIYEDDGYTGSNMNRPAMRQLFSDAKKKKFDLVLVYKQDRLSRNLKELLTLLDDLDDLGIGFKSATEPFDTTTSAGKMAIQMLGSYAEFERNRLIERVFPGMVAGVKSGRWQGARFSPYGYTYNKDIKKLEVNPKETKIVKEIFRMYLKGKSTSQIAAHFYNLGTPSRSGGKFYTKFIADILKNKVYLGMLVWNKRKYHQKEKTKDGKGKGYKVYKNDPSKIIEVPNTHEAIISQKDFNETQKILSRNSRGKVIKFKNNIYHLSGVLRCQECGRTYRGKMVVSNHRTQDKKAWYYCSSHGAYYLECSNKAIQADDIDKQVWDIVDIISKNLHVLEEMEDTIKICVSEPEECYKEQLNEKEQAIQKNLEKQKGLCAVYKEDNINIDIYKEQAELLRNEEKKLRTDTKAIHLKILEKQNSINVIEETRDFLIRLKDTSHEEKCDYSIKAFMRIIFNSVYVENQEISKIELNQPWKLCYERGIKCQKPLKTIKKEQKTKRRKPQSFWLPTAVR